MKKESKLLTNQNIFEQIKRSDETKEEYWSSRDLAKALEYSEYRHFEPVIKKAIKSCENSGQEVFNHFEEVLDMIKTGKGAEREVPSFHLSRYACYLVIQNADPNKEVVALGQTYFAVQTRRQELSDQEKENQTRLFLRSELSDKNKQLASTVKGAGVVSHLDYAIFQDHGYKGLYAGLGAKDIHKRKKLKRSHNILDHMGSTELAANLFRTTQAEDKIRREEVNNKNQANQIHHDVGKKVRKTIKELGGTMPENLPSPESIKKLQSKQRRKQLSDN